MGLEDFIDDDDDGLNTAESSSSSTSTDPQPISDDIDPDDMDFYGQHNSVPQNLPMQREKTMSDYSMSQLASTKDGDIEFGSDHVKLHCPMFFTITPKPQYQGGEHYQLKYTGEIPRPSWHNRVVACIGCYGTRLGSIKKEVVTFNTGTTDKSDSMAQMRNDINEDMDAETQVYINFFGDSFMLRDLAQANNEFREGDLINRDKIMHQVLSAKTLEARINNE